MADGSGDGVDSAGFGEAEARLVLVAACAAAGLEPAGARMLRLGEHAVFRLTSVPLIVRVGRSVDYLGAARQELAVSAWLNSSGVPTVRAAEVDADQPLIVDDRVVVFWRTSGSGDDYGTTDELATTLRRMHALVPPVGLVLPAFTPFGRSSRRLDDAAHLDPADRSYLLHRVGVLDDAYRGLRFALPPGPIHGDANVGNLLHDDDGTPVLIDLDGFATGPREWDLILTAMYYDLYGWHSADEYAAFVDGYGFDVMSWDGYHVLRDVRETMMVVWMAQNIGNDDRTAAEFAKRMRALRTGASRRDWAPF
ncbi:phosphotransferase enzyme family protein [Parafrankia elaeagni]|uniref:phosphotransferase enzyme family protein n=1 Tax=Parafrankia elaeagni TaxID=222534 RepID=UPI001E4186E2|nr:aminoglycoside phosphotransferase family protein [Parafrankia elaeagni]